MTTLTIRKAVASAAFVLAPAAMAQDIHFAQVHKDVAEFDGKQFSFQMFENISGPESKLVTGAPYAAEEKSVMTQTLADGNRIVNTTSAKLYRDQQGRTRMERSFGALPDGAGVEKTIMINDPVTSTHYVLDETNHTVTKAARGPVPERQLTLELDAKHAAEAKASGTSNRMFTFVRADGAEKGKVEDLGKQIMEGLSVEGTRTTFTIPAGQMGNERSIDIVSERWFSPDLQMVVMSKRNDPRMGETVYTVTNISRANPAAALFQVPAGYTETQNTPHTMVRRLVTHEE